MTKFRYCVQMKKSRGRWNTQDCTYSKRTAKGIRNRLKEDHPRAKIRIRKQKSLDPWGF